MQTECVDVVVGEHRLECWVDPKSGLVDDIRAVARCGHTRSALGALSPEGLRWVVAEAQDLISDEFGPYGNGLLYPVVPADLEIRLAQ